MAEPSEVVEVAGREVGVSNPDKLFFPRSGATKLDLVRYYLDVAEGALRGCDRPRCSTASPTGIDGAVGTLDSLLELADRQEDEGAADAPWPPHFPKGEGEPRRAPPSRRAKGNGD